MAHAGPRPRSSQRRIPPQAGYRRDMARVAGKATELTDRGPFGRCSAERAGGRRQGLSEPSYDLDTGQCLLSVSCASALGRRVRIRAFVPRLIPSICGDSFCWNSFTRHHHRMSGSGGVRGDEVLAPPPGLRLRICSRSGLGAVCSAPRSAVRDMRRDRRPRGRSADRFEWLPTYAPARLVDHPPALVFGRYMGRLIGMLAPAPRTA